MSIVRKIVYMAIIISVLICVVLGGNIIVSAVDCEADVWSRTKCSASCGIGTSKRTRTITKKQSFLGKSCGELEFDDTCFEKFCDTVSLGDLKDPENSCVPNDDWSSWSYPCVNNIQTRKRGVKTPASGEGIKCYDAVLIQKRFCS